MSLRIVILCHLECSEYDPFRNFRCCLISSITYQNTLGTDLQNILYRTRPNRSLPQWCVSVLALHLILEQKLEALSA
jgi:hypothetical protein